jgi:hypothetical protein
MLTGLEVLQSVQFATVKGKRLAVLGADEWEALVEWLEDIEDVQVARKSFAALDAAGGDRQKAGWVAWDEIEKDLT